MGNDCIKQNDNMYFACRKEASKYNDKLNSRESAADLLGVSTSSLADYELGNTKVVPVDKVVLMADLYNAPELLNKYCQTECPIGCRKSIGYELKSLEAITVGLLDVLSTDELNKRMGRLTHIAIDGKVDKDEQDQMTEIVAYLGEVRRRVEELEIYDQKRRGNCGDLG